MKPSFFSTRAAALTACLLGGLASGPYPRRAGAQEPAKPETLPPLSVEVVRIEVMVTEKRSRARAGLKREDFAIFEDGKPQEIVQFQAFAQAPSEPSRDDVHCEGRRRDRRSACPRATWCW